MTPHLIKQLLSMFRQPPPSICDVMPEEPGRMGFTPEAIARVPRGKGIFVQTVQRATKKGTPEALAEFAEDLGLDWVALLCIWQHDDRDRMYSETTEAAAACRANDIDVWVWGWPETAPARIERFASVMAERQKECEADGVIINVEAPYYGKRKGQPKHRAAAMELMGELRAKMPGVPIGLSSYGARFWHRSSFPWKELADRCDFGLPQVYDVHEKHGSGYPERCVDSWLELFEVVCPTLAASKRATPREMGDKLNQTPLSPAVSWWDMNHVRYSEARQAVIRGMDWWA